MRQTWLRLLLPVAGVAVLALLAANVLLAGRQPATDRAGEDGGVRQAEASVPVVGRPLPAFTLPTLEGGKVTAADLLGRPSLINFWASWCGPCREEMPDLDAVARAGADKVHILAVNEQEPAAVARGFMEQNGFKSLRVALDQDGSLFAGWNFRLLPTSVVIDAEGNVCGIYEGALDRATIMVVLARASKGCAG